MEIGEVRMPHVRLARMWAFEVIHGLWKQKAQMMEDFNERLIIMRERAVTRLNPCLISYLLVDFVIWENINRCIVPGMCCDFWLSGILASNV